jgi:four helix bundle protein
MLSFQRLDVYRASIEFLAQTVRIPKLPRGHAEVADQLRRAALSVPLNIAEGAGRPSPADAARHYAIARGSAMECAALMDVLRTLDLLDEGSYGTSLELLARVISMLTRMAMPDRVDR